MFRMTPRLENDELVLTLEGCLAGPWVGALEAYWREAIGTPQGDRIRIDLKGVCHVDSAGRELMTRMYGAGASFVARGCLMPEVVREIALSADASRRT